MAGRLVYLMGPSGSGKDTVLQRLSDLLGPSAYLAPRIVTRPLTTTEPNCVSVSPAEFERMESCGRLAMAWRANGLAYGVGIDINERLLSGCDVLLNGSRAYFPEACRRYANLIPVLLSVKPELLRQRLQDRGRENAEQVSRRLERNAQFFGGLDAQSNGVSVLLVDNSNDVDEAIRVLYAHLTEFAADRHAGRQDTFTHRPTA
jgi:ribose 1,5-bisphosphokinase